MNFTRAGTHLSKFEFSTARLQDRAHSCSVDVYCGVSVMCRLCTWPRVNRTRPQPESENSRVRTVASLLFSNSLAGCLMAATAIIRVLNQLEVRDWSRTKYFHFDFPSIACYAARYWKHERRIFFKFFSADCTWNARICIITCWPYRCFSNDQASLRWNSRSSVVYNSAIFSDHQSALLVSIKKKKGKMR